MHNASFVRSRQLSKERDIWTYYFTSPSGFSYLAGQYIETVLPHAGMDNRGDRRTFTLSSSPTEDLLAITLDFPKNCSSYKRALRALLPGDVLTIGEPMGDLVLPIDQSRPLIFIAGGLGIASYRGMLKECIDTKQQRAIQLHYALKNTDEQLFDDVLTASAAQIERYVSGERRFDAAQLASVTPKNAQYYISGSEQFVLSVRGSLMQSGVLSTEVVFDYFEGYDD